MVPRAVASTALGHFRLPGGWHPVAETVLVRKWKKVAPEEKERLAERLRVALAGQRGVTEKKMFGGTCFLLRNNMLCGTGSGNFLFRVGKEAHAAAVKRRGAKAMVHNGRRMEGFIWVDPAACAAKSLRSWLALTVGYVGALPPKKKR